MNDGFAWWLVVLGIAIGIGLVWLYMIRLPRTEADVDETEITSEADWISRTIEHDGGIAPSPLVEEVLVLHRQYLGAGAVASGSPVTLSDGPEAASSPKGAEPATVTPPSTSPVTSPYARPDAPPPGQMAEQAGE